MSNYRVGDIVKMTEDAIDNYGEEYRNVKFQVTRVATKYMNAKDFYDSGMPKGYHPGYDSVFLGEGLYDLRNISTDDDFAGSLYHYELCRSR